MTVVDSRMALGDYEVRGDGLVSGECAAGDGRVEEGEQHVIRYSTDGKPGGIFHRRCDPMQGDGSGGWYSLGDQEEAPDL